MGKAWLAVRPAEGAVEQVVQGQRRQPLLATDDVADLHQVVVDDVRQVVRRQLVCALVEDLVVERRRVDLDVAADHVVHLDVLVLGHLEAYDPHLAVGNASVDLLVRHVQRVLQAAAHCAVVGEGLSVGLGLLAQCVQLLGRVEGVVGPSVADQLLRVGQVDGFALALAVGGVRASDADSFVDLYAAPFQALDDVLLGPWDETLAVGVFDAQQEVATVVAREEVVVQGCAYSAYVQRPCRAGCEADSHATTIAHVLVSFLCLVSFLHVSYKNSPCHLRWQREPLCLAFVLPGCSPPLVRTAGSGWRNAISCLPWQLRLLRPSLPRWRRGSS